MLFFLVFPSLLCYPSGKSILLFAKKEKKRRERERTLFSHPARKKKKKKKKKKTSFASFTIISKILAKCCKLWKTNSVDFVRLSCDCKQSRKSVEKKRKKINQSNLLFPPSLSPFLSSWMFNPTFFHSIHLFPLPPNNKEQSRQLIDSWLLCILNKSYSFSKNKL